MKYNFDQIIDREGYEAYKTDLRVARFGTEEVLPLWVADMDFETPRCVLDAIKKRLEHRVLGYTLRKKDYFVPIQNWIEKKHAWKVPIEYFGFVQGVVPAIALAINEFTNKGDAVIIQTPVYHLFMSVIENNERKLVCNELINQNNRYEIDFKAFEEQIVQHQVKIFILCSPHNPGGRVWSREELHKMASICKKHHVLVISDEIHADLLLFNKQHIPFASVSEEAKNNSITLMAPSKTFNMPGLLSSFYIIPNEEIKIRLQSIIQRLECGGGNIFAYEATFAVYKEGEAWLDDLILYLEKQVNYVLEFIEEHMPLLKVMIPDASFLLWIDFSGLGLMEHEIKEMLIKEAKLGLNAGPSFGKGGEGFARLNIATSRLVLEQAMKQLKEAYEYRSLS